MRLSLLTQLGLAFGTLGLVPLAIVSWQLVDMNRTALTDQVLRLHGVTARTVAARVDSYLGARASLAAAAAANPDLVDDPQAPTAASHLRSALEAEPGLAAIALVANDRVPYLRAQRGDLDPAVRAAMAAAVPGLPVSVRAGGELWVAITVPAADGLLETAWSAAPLLELIQPEEIGEQAAVELADATGQVIAGTLPTLETLPAALVESARSGRISGAGRFANADGRTVLGAYAPVPGTSWFVVSSQPIAVAEAVAQRMRVRAGWAVAGTFALALGLLLAAYRTTVRPIRELVARAQASALGNGAPVGAGGEVAQLRLAFEALERRVGQPTTLDQEPVLLGRYQVLDALGQGGAGMVFRGWDPKLKRAVAIKTFRLDARLADTDRPALVEALLAEAVNLAGFTHPNIVSVYDVANTDEVAFVAMELVDGASLDAFVEMRGRLTADELVPIAAAVARALEAAHARHMVHGDIKPGNVLLGRDGSIKVADFGLAHALSALKPGTSSVFGTPGYIAPEMLLNEGGDQRIDLFALGVLMFRCLTGVLPFEGESPSEIFVDTMMGRRRSLASLGVELDPRLEMVVTTLMETDPSARLLSAAAVAGVLEKLAASRRLAWQAPDDLMRARLVRSLHQPGASAPVTVHLPPPQNAARLEGGLA